MMPTLDKKDQLLLKYLMQDSTIPLKILGEKCHMSEATCSRRIARLKKQKIIKSYRAVVDKKALGQTLAIFVLLQLTNDNAAVKNHFIKRLSKAAEVVMLHMVTGEVDYVMELQVDKIEAYQQFAADYFEQEPIVKKYTTLVSLKEYSPTAG